MATNLIQEPGLAERIIGHVLGFTTLKPPPSAAPPPQPAHSADASGGHALPSEPDDLWYWALLKTLRADMRSDKLLPPGDIYWINALNALAPPTPAHAIPLTLHEVEDVEMAFSEMLFSKSMFFDHLASNYENALDALAAALAEEEVGTRPGSDKVHGKEEAGPAMAA